MLKSKLSKSRWVWRPDPLGSPAYNILGGLECVLFNTGLIKRLSDWDIDEMERFSYKFCNEYNLLPPPSNYGLIELDDISCEQFLKTNK